MILASTPKLRPLRLTALLLIAVGLYGWARSERPTDGEPHPCASTGDGCADVDDGHRGLPVTTPATLAATDFCSNVGYLCAGLAEEASVRLRRWSDFDGTIVVHIPLPDFAMSSSWSRETRATRAGRSTPASSA